MGSKYKKKLEVEWDGLSLSDMKMTTKYKIADRNITEVLQGKHKRRSK